MWSRDGTAKIPMQHLVSRFYQEVLWTYRRLKKLAKGTTGKAGWYAKIAE